MGIGVLSARTGAVPDASSRNVIAIILTIVFFMFFSLWWIFLIFRKRTSVDLAKGTYCVVQGLGQHTGTGTPSARTSVVPEGSSKNVTKMILTIVFFMFFSLW